MSAYLACVCTREVFRENLAEAARVGLVTLTEYGHWVPALKGLCAKAAKPQRPSSAPNSKDFRA